MNVPAIDKQHQSSDLTGINEDSRKQSELGKRKTINSDFLEKITKSLNYKNIPYG